MAFIGFFMMLNKNLKQHPYPMITVAILAGAAYQGAYSYSYLRVAKYFYQLGYKDLLV